MGKFEAMFARWRGYMVIRRVPPEDRDMLKRKLLAWELVGAGSGRTSRQNWGVNRRWYGDYLSQEQMPPDYTATIQDIRNRDGVNNIIFSSRVKKINRFKKTSDRYLVVIHMRNKNDIVVCLTSPSPGQDWIGELSAAIATAKQDQGQFRVQVGNEIHCNMG